MQKIAAAGPRPSPKREAVLDAARASFLELGYAATSMDLVASRAGVSKATIYAHFAGKDDLFAAVIHRRCEQGLSGGPMWPAERDARTTLTAVAALILDLLMAPEAIDMYRVVVAEAARHPELARAFWDAGPGEGRVRLAAMFAELDGRALLAVADPRAAADQFVSMLRGEVFHRALLGLPRDGGRGIDATRDSAVDVILAAYAP